MIPSINVCLLTSIIKVLVVPLVCWFVICVLSYMFQGRDIIFVLLGQGWFPPPLCLIFPQLPLHLGVSCLRCFHLLNTVFFQLN